MEMTAVNPVELSSRPQERPRKSSALTKWLLVFSQLYRQEATEAAVWAYRESLDDLSAEEIELACREAIRRLKFFPTPAEIRECLTLARANSKPLQQARLPEAEEETPDDRVAREEALARLREIANHSLIPSAQTSCQKPDADSHNARVEPRDSMIEQGKLAMGRQTRIVPPVVADTNP